MTEEINYKEFAERFYNLLKVSPLSNMPLVKEYENATKPKMTKLEGCENLFQVFAYKDRTYVLFYNNWYLLDGGQLHLGGGEELNEAYKSDYEAAQSKDAGGYQPTPQSPEETAEGLRNAMIQAKKEGVFDEPKFTELPTLYGDYCRLVG